MLEELIVSDSIVDNYSTVKTITSRYPITEIYGDILELNNSFNTNDKVKITVCYDTYQRYYRVCRFNDETNVKSSIHWLFNRGDNLYTIADASEVIKRLGFCINK